jgi:hypothetical protein
MLAGGCVPFVTQASIFIVSARSVALAFSGFCSAGGVRHAGKLVVLLR